jgi:hypothetical protein
VAVNYWSNNQTGWFLMTCFFIVVPSIIVNVIAVNQSRGVSSCATGVMQLSLVFRYLEAFKRWESKESNVELTYKLAKLRYIETITQSAPQWWLQAYIMLRQWQSPDSTLVSIVLSLLSLAWSMTFLEITKNPNEAEEERNDDLRVTVVLLIWQFFTLISRLSAIVIVAYVFRWFLILFLVLHLVVLVAPAVMYYRTVRTEQNGMNSQQNDQNHQSICRIQIISIAVACYPFLFHSSKSILPQVSVLPPSFDKPLKWRRDTLFGYLILVLANLCMLLFSLLIPTPDSPHMDLLKPVVIVCVVGGTFISGLFYVLHYYVSHRFRYPNTNPNRNSLVQPTAPTMENEYLY